MTFDLTTISILVAVAAFVSLLPGHWRGWALMCGSLVGVYWLQPFLIIRYADFLLPTATIFLTVLGWLLTRPSAKTDDADNSTTAPGWRANVVTLMVIVGVVVLMASFRFIDASYRLTASRPPNPLYVAIGMSVLIIPFALTGHRDRSQTALLVAGAVVVVGLFIIQKTTPLVTWVAEFGRTLTNRDPTLANPATDLTWLGFSYVAFRLLHTLRDRQTGLLPALSLRDYMTYVIFTPAYIAGPIDRAERFQKDMIALPAFRGLDPTRWTEGLGRIAVGMFKKFVVADSLALGLALSPVTALQTESTFWLWILLYGYALRLFFDFSGYSDIAIGLGILFGIKLPENFDRPYLKTDITTFWQSWHKTLSDWARFYVFSPLSRTLLRRKPKPSPVIIVLSAQVATMVTIGLWHGVTVNFLFWGLWHGIGLFAHKQWTDRTRKWYRGLKDYPQRLRLWKVFAWFLTFHYVVLGWVWFALPNPSESLLTFARLFGMR